MNGWPLFNDLYNAASGAHIWLINNIQLSRSDIHAPTENLIVLSAGKIAGLNGSLMRL